MYSNTFNNFLAQHGKDKLKQIVDSYDSMVPFYGNDRASSEIKKYFNIDQTTLNEAIKFVTNKEGRIIPIDQQKKDLEAKVGTGYNNGKVVPISEAKTYGKPKQRREGVPTQPIAYAYAQTKGYAAGNDISKKIIPENFQDYSPPNIAVDSPFRPSRFGTYRKTNIRRRIVGGIAAAVAFFYITNPFTGLMGTTRYEAIAADPQTRTETPRLQKMREELEKYKKSILPQPPVAVQVAPTPAPATRPTTAASTSAVTPPAAVTPQVEYESRVYTVERGDVLTNIVIAHSFEGKNVNDLVKDAADYNNVTVDSKLKKGQTVYVPKSFGEDGVWYVESSPAREGETLYSLVRRVVNNEVNKEARANKLSVDNRLVTTVENAVRNNYDIAAYIMVGGEKKYAVINRADGIIDGPLRVGQKITLEDYKVIKGKQYDIKPKKVKSVKAKKPVEVAVAPPLKPAEVAEPIKVEPSPVKEPSLEDQLKVLQPSTILHPRL